MKIVFIYNKRPNSTLTHFFTGSSCYHVGFTDGVKFWDMHEIRRRRNWVGLYPLERVLLAECPVDVTAQYLDDQLDTDRSTYGYVDYMLFCLRWAYHLVGQSTRNAGGVICSELVANDLAKNGWTTRFAEVPSPADLESAIFGRKDALNT